jgi:N-acetylmuramoyl-L-alanine amidase
MKASAQKYQITTFNPNFIAMPFKLSPVVFFFLFLVAACFPFHQTCAQTERGAFIRLTDPLKESTTSNSATRFIIGSTCTTCKLLINDEPIRVYPSGAFAHAIHLDSGVNTFALLAIDAKGKKKEKRISFQYQPPEAPKPTKDWIIEQFQVFPKGDLWLRSGDPVHFRIKARTGGKLIVQPGNILLHELPDSLTQSMPGIYQGTYIIQSTDTFQKQAWQATLITPSNDSIRKNSNNACSILKENEPFIVETTGRLAYLEYGMGDDRLGGAKMGYLDSAIRLQVVGKIDQDYRIRLTQNRHAFIPIEHVRNLPSGIWPPQSLTGKIKLIGKEKSDLLQLQLFQRLPYHTQQRLDPSMIVLDVFGATNNTNWIDQPDTIREIKRVQLEQIADGHVRLFIYLKHPSFWGHRVYYEGNNLILEVNRAPASLALNNLTIGLDAGHGGSNTGAAGALNIAEKTISLAITQKIDSLLRKAGAKTILTRNTDQTVENRARILFFRDSTPDLLLSIHLNSSSDPFKSAGTSTFYRYEGFRPLSQSIYKRLLELDLPEYGNNGAFNFMLNGPTEYPNALIETLFLSNPEEEMKILDESFQWKMAEKIIAGLQDYLIEQAILREDTNEDQ